MKQKKTLRNGQGRGYSGFARVLTMLALMLFVSMGAWAQTTYTVTLKDGTEDADKWTIAPAEATTTGVDEGTEIKATYSGTKRVKGVKAVKKAPAAATVTTAPTAKTGVKTGEDVAIVNAGAAEGGTMMYMVNATKPTTTEGFSATVPTAKTIVEAGKYYVWYYVKADDSHTDSEISASGIEVEIAAAVIPTLADAFTNGAVVRVRAKAANNTSCGIAGTYSTASGTYSTTGDADVTSMSMTKDGSNLKVTITSIYNTYTVTFNTTDNTYIEDASSNVSEFRMTELQSIIINGVDITSTMTKVTLETITWGTTNVFGVQNVTINGTNKGPVVLHQFG